MLERGEVADGGEHRDVLEAYRMFAHDRGWLHRLREAVPTGLTAEAAVERVQSDTRARMLRATDPYLRERLHDLDDLANRLMHQLHRPGPCAAARPAAGQRHPRRALDGAGGAARLRPQAPARPRAGGRRPDLACRDRRARARHSRRRRDRQRHRPRRSRRRHHRRRRRPATCICGRRPTSKRPMSSGCGCARAGRRNTSRCATSPASPRTAQKIALHDQCRPRRRPAAYRGDRRRRHRPVPHRTAVHGGADASRAPASSSRSIAPCSMPRATSR